MITNGGTISVVVNDEERKLETSLFINSNGTIYNVFGAVTAAKLYWED